MAHDPITAGLGLVDKFIGKFVKDKDLAEELRAKARSEDFNFDLQELKAKVSVILAEASGGWLQRNWRPLTMVWFSVLLGMYWFGYAPDYLVNNPETVDQLFDLLKLGIGGYVVGRSAEKIADKWNPKS